MMSGKHPKGNILWLYQW